MKEFSFVVRIEDKTKILTMNSKHLQGAIRKLYQTYTFDEIVKIL